MKDKVVIDINKMTLQDKHVLVIPVEIENTTGLVDADQYEDKSEFGRVVLSAEDVSIKKDSVVLFGKYSTVQITIDGVDYLLVRSEDIIAVIG